MDYFEKHTISKVVSFGMNLFLQDRNVFLHLLAFGSFSKNRAEF